MDDPIGAGPLRVRFAPVPVSSLRVGNARTALFNWLLARGSGGALILRFSDAAGTSDGSSHEREAAVMRDLRWLGLSWDEGPEAGGSDGPYRRSERADIYAAHLEHLLSRDAAYERDGAVWFRVPPGATVVDDAIKGDVTFAHGALADFMLRDAAGTASDTLAAAVDDGLARIDLVLRGDEHLDDTPRQILIARALGFAPPRYAHAGMVVEPSAAAAGEGGIDAFRRAGFLPAAMIEHLALLGWSPPGGGETFSLDELVRTFTLERVGGSPSVFDVDRLRAFNARVLRALPKPAYRELIAQWMQRAGLLETPAPDAALRWIETFVEAYGGEVHTLGEALSEIAALREESVVLPALELERLRNRQVLFYLDAVSQYVDAQPELRELPLAQDLPVIASEFGLSAHDAFAAVRMALTGRPGGPPLGLLFPLLGHDRIMIRVGAVSSHILHGRGLEPLRFGPGGVPFTTIQATPPDAQATGPADPGS